MPLRGTKKLDGTPWLVVAQWGGRGKPTFIDTASFETALPSDAIHRTTAATAVGNAKSGQDVLEKIPSILSFKQGDIVAIPLIWWAGDSASV